MADKDRVGLHVATLRARMSDENFALLSNALHQWWHVVEDGSGEGVLDIDEGHAGSRGPQGIGLGDGNVRLGLH